jgi:hypothetical protein
MDFGITTVIAITVLCYLIGYAVKCSGVDNKWIPLACGVSGVVLGLVALYTGMVDFPAQDALTAAAVGAASGLAATGTDQAIKQLASK